MRGRARSNQLPKDHAGEELERQRVKSLMAQGAIFVFGSNEAGLHGGGAARFALDHYKAKWGRGFGLQGQCFAIPTKDASFNTLPLDRIQTYVDMLVNFATFDSAKVFAVTRIGCGLAGLTDEQIAPMFRNAPRNCMLPYGWRTLNGEEE